MELIIFALLVLFSIFSTLMKRHKQRKEVEARQQQQQRDGLPRPDSAVEIEEEEQEESPWSFDPFELPQSRRQKQAAEAEEGAAPSAPQEMERLTEEAGDQARQSEERAREMQQQVHELQRQARELQPRQRIQELVRQRLQQEAGPSARRKRGWKLDPEEARRAIVYAEILGKAKAERDEEV